MAYSKAFFCMVYTDGLQPLIGKEILRTSHCYVTFEKGRDAFSSHSLGISLVLCSSQPARDWKSCFFYFFIFFHFDHHFFGLKIIIPFLFRFSFFIFFTPVFHPFGIFIFLVSCYLGCSLSNIRSALPA